MAGQSAEQKRQEQQRVERLRRECQGQQALFDRPKPKSRPEGRGGERR